MNRKTVIVDGTKPGSAVCSNKGSAQNFGLGGSASSSASPYAVKAADRRLGRQRDDGVEGRQRLGPEPHRLQLPRRLAATPATRSGGTAAPTAARSAATASTAQYLTATSTYFKNESATGEVTAAQYGIFSSNWSGGTWNQIYASNFNDSGYYIGACQQVCDQTVNHAWAEYNALGYSGSNSGGAHGHRELAVRQQRGRVRHQQPERRQPVAPERRLPRTASSAPVTHTHSCWVFIHNYVHDNNNPNVPAAGSAAAGPVGTGMSISGGRNDTVMDNTFVRQQRVGRRSSCRTWTAARRATAACSAARSAPTSCLCDDYGDALVGNTFPTTAPTATPPTATSPRSTSSRDPGSDCYRGNHEAGGGAVQPASAAAMQTSMPNVRHHDDPVGQQRQPVPGRGPVRLPGADRPRHPRQLPQRQLPAGDQDRHAPAAQEPEVHAQPVRRGAVEPVVQGGARGRLTRLG